MQGDRLTTGDGAPAAWTPEQWVERLREWALALGFSQIGVAGEDLESAEPGLVAWLEAGWSEVRPGKDRNNRMYEMSGSLRICNTSVDAGELCAG